MYGIQGSPCRSEQNKSISGGLYPESLSPGVSCGDMLTPKQRMSQFENSIVMTARDIEILREMHAMYMAGELLIQEQVEQVDFVVSEQDSSTLLKKDQVSVSSNTGQTPAWYEKPSQKCKNLLPTVESNHLCRSERLTPTTPKEEVARDDYTKVYLSTMMMLKQHEKYSGIIMWVCEQKGLFKIYNTRKYTSVLAGLRGRKVIKYNNLSRSLRYYQKQDGTGVLLPLKMMDHAGQSVSRKRNCFYQWNLSNPKVKKMMGSES